MPKVLIVTIVSKETPLFFKNSNIFYSCKPPKLMIAFKNHFISNLPST